MAYIQIHFNSACLFRSVPVNVILPNDSSPIDKQSPHYQREMKTLFLLHGFTGNHTDWINNTRLPELCVKYNLAAVCPAGENSFYLDRDMLGEKYGSFIGEELVRYIRSTFGIAQKPENTFIGGLSMGGYGALRNGLKYHQTFGKIFAFSSALITYDLWEHKLECGGIADNENYYRRVFGDSSKLQESDKNPEYLIKQLCLQHERVPEIYMTCGTEDDLLEKNRRLAGTLKDYEIPVQYCESAGGHTWEYWNQMLEPAIEWIVK